jgi:pimeloyl-ACP methyl ester carboxylesterase
MVAIVESLGLDRPVAMGHSMGASTATAAVASRPDLFRAAVLEDPPWTQRAAGARDWEARARLRDQFLDMLKGTKDEIAARGRAQNPHWHPDEFDAWAESKTQFRPPASWSERFTKERPRWQDDVARIECPVLLLRGGNAARGRIVDDEASAEAQGLCPTIEVVVFPEAGHNVRREAYDDYVAAVRAFLAAHS